MKCDKCDSEATVHEVSIRAHKKIERHLCDACARKEGLAVNTPTPLTELLSQYIALQVGQGGQGATAGQAIAPPPIEACPTCGMTFTQFRKDEKLGCADCYAAFERQLGGLIERIHEGATHHVGKSPKRLLGGGRPAEPGPEGVTRPAVVVVTPAELQRRVTTLQKQLDEAVLLEQYERAAQLRDDLLKLQKMGPPPSPPSGPDLPRTGDSI